MEQKCIFYLSVPDIQRWVPSCLFLKLYTKRYVSHRVFILLPLQLSTTWKVPAYLTAPLSCLWDHSDTTWPNSLFGGYPNPPNKHSGLPKQHASTKSVIWLTLFRSIHDSSSCFFPLSFVLSSFCRPS